MAGVHSVVRWLLVALLGCLGAWQQAHAYPATSEPQYQIPGIPATKGSTLALVCSNNFYWFAGSYGGWAVVDDSAAPSPYYQGKSCVMSCPSCGTPTASNYSRKDYFQILASELKCNAGGTLSGSQCVCPAGQVDTGTSCSSAQAAYCASVAGTYGGDRVVKTASSVFGTTQTVCVDGLGPLSDGSFASCSATGPVGTAGQDRDGGSWYGWVSPATYTGSTCSGSETASVPPKQDPEPCTPTTCAPPKGKCPGTVNGVAVWVECSESTSQKKTEEESTTQNPDGTTTTKEGDTTQTTTCSGGTCVTTTVTNTTVNGSTTTSTGSSSASKGEYCKGNPDDPQCGDTGGWGGTCTAGFQCSGDPVLCAAAKGVWQQKCALIDGPATATTEQSAYTAAKAGGTGYQMTTTTVSISAANFDSSNSLGVSGQCLADIPIVVWGTSISVPISNVCPHLATLGTIMLALAWLMAAVIVGKGVTA
jgi:hypothetical protein